MKNWSFISLRKVKKLQHLLCFFGLGVLQDIWHRSKNFKQHKAKIFHSSLRNRFQIFYTISCQICNLTSTGSSGRSDHIMSEIFLSLLYENV